MNILARKYVSMAWLLPIGLAALLSITLTEVFRSGWQAVIWRHYILYGLAMGLIVGWWILCLNRTTTGPRDLVLGIGLLALAWITVSGKIGALVATTVFLAGNCALGAFVLRWFESRNQSSLPGMVRMGLSLMLGLGINGYAIWIAMHFKINFSYIYYLLFLAEIILFRHELLAMIGSLKEKLSSGQWSIGQRIILAFALLYLPYALVSFYVWDDVGVHLYFPKVVSLYGICSYTPAHFMSYDHAIISRSAYTAAYLLGGEFAVRLLNYCIFQAAFLIFEKFVRQRWEPTAAWLSTLVLILTPFVLWQMGTVFIDSFSLLAVCILLMQVFDLLESPTSSGWVLFWVLAAFAYLSKQMTFFVIAPMVLIALLASIVHVWQGKGLRPAWGFAGGLLLFAVLLLPVLYIAYRNLGGEGVFYLDAAVKRLLGRPSAAATAASLVDKRWLQPLTPTTLWAMIFQGSKFAEIGDYAFGFFFLLLPFVPMLLFVKHIRRDALVLFFIFISGCLIWFGTTGPYLRYFLVILPSGAILLALTSERLLAVVRPIGWARVVTISVFSAAASLNFLAQIGSKGIAYPYPLWESLSNQYIFSNAAYLEREQRTFRYAGIKYGKEAKGLLLGAFPALYFADFHIEGSVYFSKYLQNEIFLPSRNAQDLFANIFVRKHYDFIITPAQSGNDLADSPAFRKMLTTEISEGRYSLLRPRPEYLPSMQAQFRGERR